jgi:hypothetical protein
MPYRPSSQDKAVLLTAARTRTSCTIKMRHTHEYGGDHAAFALTVEKRDRAGQYMAHLESQSALADAEIKRLRERKGIPMSCPSVCTIERRTALLDERVARAYRDRGRHEIIVMIGDGRSPDVNRPTPF